MFISIAINRITLKLVSECWIKMLLQLPHMHKNDAFDQQPAVRCQTDEKMADPGVNQRDNPSDNADPVS